MRILSAWFKRNTANIAFTIIILGIAFISAFEYQSLTAINARTEQAKKDLVVLQEYIECMLTITPENRTNETNEACKAQAFVISESTESEQ